MVKSPAVVLYDSADKSLDLAHFGPACRARKLSVEKKLYAKPQESDSSGMVTRLGVSCDVQVVERFAGGAFLVEGDAIEIPRRWSTSLTHRHRLSRR